METQTRGGHVKIEAEPRLILLQVKHACMLSHFSHAQLFATLWGYNPSGSSAHGILWVRILEWVAMPSSRASSQPRDQTRVSCISCIGRPILYHQCHLGSPTSKELPKIRLSSAARSDRWYRFSLRSLRQNQSGSHLDFSLLASRTGRQIVYLFKLSSLF